MASARARRSRRPTDHLPASHTLTCLHCHQAFVPVKRGTQKFCKAACRSTYSKQKKAGTQGKFTHLPGPPRGGLTFLETVAAAGVGAATANAGEYVLVTRHLVTQSEQHTQQLAALTGLLQQTLQRQVQLQQQLAQVSQGLAAALQALHVAPDTIAQLLPPAAPLATFPPQAATAPEAKPVPVTDTVYTPEQQALVAQLLVGLSLAEPTPTAQTPKTPSPPAT